jgi:protease-4
MSVGRNVAMGCGLVFLVFTGILVLFLIGLSLVGEHDLAALAMGGKVGLVEVEGQILDARGIIDQLERQMEDASVKAVVLRVNSPGGAVAPTQEIYDEIFRLRESGKPVVASLGAVAASGGYYVACAADTVLASPGTLTGSIGVIMTFPNAQELLRKVGLSFQVVKSGPNKDVGSMYREMTPEEKRLLQDVIDDVYDQFVEAVMRGRGLSREEVAALADGTIFSGRQARELGLVDRLGGLSDAVDLAGKLGGIRGKPVVVKKVRRRFDPFDLIGSMLQETRALRDLSVRLEYRLQ